MMRFWAALFAATFLASNAWAGAGTVTGKDASGATVTFATTTDGSSNNLARTVICDATAGANCAAVQSAGADGVSNTTAALAVYNFPLLWNGTTWDRWKGDATNGAWVNVKTSVLPTGASTAANQSTIITALGSPFQAGGSIGNTSFAATQSGAWNVTNISGTVSLPTGASTAANQSTGNTSLATIATNTGAPPPLGTTGGWTPTTLTAITNSSQTVKNSAGQLGYILCDNPNNAWTYLQLFNATSPSVGTNVGFIPLPPNLSGGMTLSVVGLQFSNSIKVAATTTPTGSTAPATANINCSFGYN